MSFYYAEKIISEFGYLQGLTLDLASGAVCFQQENGEAWCVEIISDGDHLLLHHNFSGLGRIDGVGVNKLMELNANYSFMQGAWFGLHQATQSCRIFKLVQVDSLTVSLMREHLKKLIHLVGAVKKEIPLNLA
ncbi:TPA: CesT family type III secretion system chaperone [Pseudomonas putida]|nr:CesT family type III secretion system chaperone [Pseudomonas putida]